MISFDLASHWKRAWRSAMLAGILGTGIRVGANLVLLPIVLLKLSAGELAIWWVFIALGNFGNLADFGFGSTIPRIYNYLLAGAEDFEAEGLREAKPGSEANYEGIRRVNATVRSLYLKISLVAIGLLAVGGTFALLKPAAESGLAGKVWIYWGLFIIAIGYNLATSHWVLALQGLNRMRDLQLTYVIGSGSFVLSAAVLLYCKCGVASMVIATFVKGFLMHGRCHQIYRRIVPSSEKPVTSDKHILKKLWPNAYKFGVLSLGAYCLSNGNVMICSQFLGKDVTASFGLTVQIGNYLVAFAGLWLTVKWPEIGMLRAQGRLNQMSILFSRRLALVMLTYVGMAVVIFFAGNRLLELKGSHTRLLDWPHLALYLIYMAIQAFYVQFGSLAYTENTVPFFKIGLFTGLGAIACSLLLTPIFGLWGLLIAPLLAELSCSAWYTVRRGFQGQPLSPGEFVIAALRGMV